MTSIRAGQIITVQPHLNMGKTHEFVGAARTFLGSFHEFCTPPYARAKGLPSAGVLGSMLVIILSNCACVLCVCIL